MGTYLLRRLVGTIPVMVLISLLVFLLIQAAPGDPTLMLLGEDSTAEDIAEARVRWGLDQPVYVQYVKFFMSAAQGNLGRSFKYDEPVLDVIINRIPATLELAAASLIIAVIFAIPLGGLGGGQAQLLGGQHRHHLRAVRHQHAQLLVRHHAHPALCRDT